MAAFTGLSVPSWLDVSNAPKAEFALARACERVRRKLQQRVDLVNNETILLSGTNTRALILPELPVIAVDSVFENGAAVTDWTVDKDAGLLWRTEPGYWPRGNTYTIQYDHGFATVPDDIAGVVYELTARYLADPGQGGVQQETVTGYSVVYAVTDDELLDTLGDRVVRKVPTS